LHCLQLKCGFSEDLLLNSGLALTTEPFLRSLLLAVYRQKLGELLARTRIEVDPEKGRSMMGTADETGSLRYGEVFVQYSAKLGQPSVDTRVLTGTVVIAKNPCFHPGDMRKFQAVDNPALRHMVDVVVFPTEGPRPHPNEMSGSDLDGDMYFVCWEDSLLPSKPNQEPMDYSPNVKELLKRQINEDDMITFLGRYVESDQLGVIANAHLVHADAQNDHIFSKQCRDLAQKHSDAVDFPKTGCLVTITPDLRPQSYPPYMRKRDKPTYRSNHVLAALYNQCKAIDSTIQSSYQTTARPAVDDRFLLPGYESYLDSARELLDYYRGQMRILTANYRFVNEAEVVSGHVYRIAQKQSGTLKGEYVDTVDLVRRQLETIKLKMRSTFFEEFGGEAKKAECREQAMKKISAVYRVAYDSDEEDFGLGLPWIFVELLMEARSNFCSPENSVDERQSTVSDKTCIYSASLMEFVSNEIASFTNSLASDEQLLLSRKKRMRALEILRTVKDERQLSAINFVCFGSTVTQFDHPSSTLDIFVAYGADDVSSPRAVEIVSDAFNASPLIGKRAASDGNRPLKLIVDEQDVVVYWTERSLRRTAKILAVTSKHKCIIPVLNVVLRWARERNISGSHRECLLKPEQLVLLFIAFFEKSLDNGVRTTAEDIEAARERLLANHFLDCEISQCQHIGTSQCGPRHEPVNADILLRFLQHYSQLRGQLVKDASDVAFPDEDLRLVKLADPQYGRIADRMLQAYYTLASSGSLKELLQISVSASSKEHRVIPLARQVASIVIFCQEYYEEKLQRTSGATSVKILRKRFRNAMAGLCLDVWGDQRSLLLIEDNIRDLEQMSVLYVRSSAAVERQLIHGAYLTVFENSAGPSVDLTLEQSVTLGVQPNHRRMQENGMIHVPRLLSPSSSDAHSLERFINSVMKQVEFLNQSYDETLFGELRAVLSYGTCYMIAERPPPTITEEEFLDRVNLALPTNNENLVNPDRALRRPRAQRTARDNRRPWTAGQTGHHTYSSMAESFPHLAVDRGRRAAGRRGRGGRSRGSCPERGSNAPSIHWREAFITAKEFHTERFGAFLEDNGFDFDEDYQVYLITVKLNMSGYQSNIDSVLVLDEQQRLKGLTMTDTKWICVNIHTDKSVCPSGRRPVNDIRFRIHSRVSLSPQEMAKHSEDCADLIEGHSKLLTRNQNGDVIGVAPDYRKRIHFVRYKNCQIYQLTEHPQVRSAWSLDSLYICGLLVAGLYRLPVRL